MLNIPKYGIGTYTVQGDRCTNIIYEGLKLGYRLIDMAELYKNHDAIKNGINKAKEEGIITRNDIWYTSKIHNKDQRCLNIGPAIKKILYDLDIDSIDLILLHSAQKNYTQAYEELLRCKEHFNVRNIGVSNFRKDELENIINKTNVKPYLNQIELSPFNQRKEFRNFMDINGIKYQAYGSLTCGKGFKHEKLINQYYSPDELLLGWAKYYNLTPIPTGDTIENLCKNFETLNNVSLNEDTINYLNSIDDVIINYKQHADKKIEN